jgi:hypothetical protein
LRRGLFVFDLPDLKSMIQSDQLAWGDLPGLAAMQPFLNGLKSGQDFPDLAFAVSGVLFRGESLLLTRRGPKARDENGKLEFVGGETIADLSWDENLRRETCEEFGAEVRIAIDGVLCAQLQQFDPDSHRVWCIISCLCRLVEGVPTCQEVGKIDEICELSIADWFAIQESQLSRSTARERDAYRMCYGSRAYWMTGSLRIPVVFSDL